MGNQRRGNHDFRRAVHRQRMKPNRTTYRCWALYDKDGELVHKLLFRTRKAARAQQGTVYRARPVRVTVTPE